RRIIRSRPQALITTGPASMPAPRSAISGAASPAPAPIRAASKAGCRLATTGRTASSRSEEHTSELQSREKLVWRLLLEKQLCAPRSSRDHRAPREPRPCPPRRSSDLSPYYSQPAAGTYYSWAGFYAGAQVGYQWGSVPGTGTNPSGVEGGLQAGYNWQNGQFEIGRAHV